MSIDQNSRHRPIHFLIRSLEILNMWKCPAQIVEIGCMRQPCNHDIYDCSSPCCNDGHSTLFWLLSGHHITTCDIDPYSISIAKSIIIQKPTNTEYKIHHGDGINFLQEYDGLPIDLLYLDGWDVGSNKCAEYHLDAYTAAKDKLSPRHMILIDDTDVDYINDECEFIDGCMAGKGRLLIPHLLNAGYKMEFCSRQTLLIKE